MALVFWKEDKEEKHIGLCVWIGTVQISLKLKEKVEKKNHIILIYMNNERQNCPDSWQQKFKHVKIHVYTPK